MENQFIPTTMSPVLRFAVLCALLCESVLGVVRPPTDISVVCHNFENVLYWNYSDPPEQLKFIVEIEGYESDFQMLETSQTHLNISRYSSNADDDYLVYVSARVGQEKSGKISIKFTYSKDFFDETIHKFKCSLDFPAIETSVHKDVIRVSFKHPYVLYGQDILNDEFKYTVTHDEIKTAYSCFDDVEEGGLCIEEIHMNHSAVGQCIDLKFEGLIAAIPSHTHRNACLPQPPPENDKSSLFLAFICGGIVVIFIFIGVLWLLCKKGLEIPNFPKSLHNIMSAPCHPALETEHAPVSHLSPLGHTPLLTTPDICLEIGSTVDEDGSKTTSSLVITELVEPGPSEEEENYDSSGFSKSSDYDCPKCLLEIGPGDFTEGYGPRPRILPESE